MIVSAVALSLPPLLNHAAAAEFVKTLSAAIRASHGKTNGVCTVDASALVSFDSSALAVLLECRRQALISGLTFFVLNASPRLAQLATLYGVVELMPSSNSGLTA